MDIRDGADTAEPPPDAAPRATRPATLLPVAETLPSCRTLGPGSRFVVWVQGCPLDCADCVSPQWIPFTGGRPTAVAALAADIAEHAADGLTVSGGEPFAHAAALTELLDRVRALRPGLSVAAYTGFTLEHLRRHGDGHQQALLDRLDLLIDGPYLRSRHGDLLWRGSDNQRIHRMSERHHPAELSAARGVGVQIDVTDDGSVRWSGVPPIPGFRPLFEQATGAQGPDETEERQP